MASQANQRYPNPVETTLVAIRAAGLLAEPSALEHGGIVGGPSSTETSFGTVFQSAFHILPCEDGFVAAVAGPGNMSHELRLPTIAEAAEAVIAEFRRRGTLQR